eukprot:9377342-Pyramimonas_sp.AAC.1
MACLGGSRPPPFYISKSGVPILCSKFKHREPFYKRRAGLHGWRAGDFQNVPIALAPRTFVPNFCKHSHGLGAVPFEHAVLGLVPRAFASTFCKSFTD